MDKPAAGQALQAGASVSVPASTATPTPSASPASSSASASSSSSSSASASSSSSFSASSFADAPPHPAFHGTPPILHWASLAALVLGPVGLLLPPRRMSLRNLMLASGTVVATSQLSYDYTGLSLLQRYKRRMGQLSQSMELPEAARQRQAAMQAERARRAAAAAEGDGASSSSDRGVIKRIWMGHESEDWAKERARREKAVLDAGGGYWDLILAQVGEVWTDLTGKGKGSGEGASSERPAEPKR